jgi:hypothetical protein
MEAIVNIIDTSNNLLGTIVMPWAAVVILAYVFIAKTLPSLVKKNGMIGGLYLWFLTIMPIVIWILIFWFGQTFIVLLIGKDINLPPWVARWIWIWITFCSMAYFMTKEHGEKRGIKSMALHLGTFLLGWIFGKWFGIFFISLPILSAYYNSMYRLVDGIIPVSDPNDKKEKWQRFRLFFWYTWGIQYPIQVAHDSNVPKRDADIRISGSPSNNFSTPGLIWLKSHQAAALTVGVNFSRIEGPRVIYTKPRERLLEIIDLRTLKRTASIDAVSKDGVRFKAVVSASFALDREQWSSETYNQLYHRNPTLLHGMELDANKDGIYPFSGPRIHAALRMRGKTSNTPEKQTPIYWDERVFNHVEVIASHVLSERKFDELWHPIHDGLGISALDEIADEIKTRVTPELLTQGARVFAARVVAFDFSEYKEPKDKTELVQDETKQQDTKEAQSKDSENKGPDKNHNTVINQQIKSWRVDWESQRLQTIVDAEAEANRMQQAARAHVQSVLLTAIAEGLDQTRVRYPNLPRHVIAMHFVGALEQLIHQEQESESSGEASAVNLIQARGRWTIERKER